MKCTKFFSFFFLIIILVSVDCAPVYLPSPVDAPMLTNRGEKQVNLLLGLGVAPQVSYALTNHIGLIGNGYYYNSKSDSSYARQFSLALGSGYFGRIGKHGRYEVYLGFDGGKMDNNYSQFFYKDIFLQPTIGFTSDIIDLGLSSSFVAINFSDLKGAYLKSPLSTVFWKPTLTAKIGYKRFRVLTQVGFAYDFKQNTDLPIFPLLFSVGINVNIGQSRYVWKSVPRYNVQ